MPSSRMALPCCQIGVQPSHLRDLRAVPRHMTRHDQKAVDAVNGLHHAMWPVPHLPLTPTSGIFKSIATARGSGDPGWLTKGDLRLRSS